MTINTYETYKELRPAEGKVLYDGNNYVTAVAMPINADHSVWSEVEEPEEDNEISEAEALDIITGGM